VTYCVTSCWQNCVLHRNTSMSAGRHIQQQQQPQAQANASQARLCEGKDKNKVAG
jgi:hypothetical protein